MKNLSDPDPVRAMANDEKAWRSPESAKAKQVIIVDLTRDGEEGRGDGGRCSPSRLSARKDAIDVNGRRND